MAVKYGTSFSDNLTGTNTADVFFAYDGNDYIFSGGGSGDYIDAGGGHDFISLSGSVSSTVYLGSGNDIVSTTLGGNKIDGGTGSDLLDYSQKSTQGLNINLATGQVTGFGLFSMLDTVSSFERVYGTEYGDSITGSAFADELKGWGGNDTIKGGNGFDKIEGGAGNDMLFGEIGADYIFGGTGNNYIDVGASSAELSRFGEKDIVRHEANANQATVDHIYNFDVAGSDLIELYGTGYLNFGILQAYMSQQGNDVFIQTGYNSSIVLHGVSMNSLTANDFAFFSS